MNTYHFKYAAVLALVSLVPLTSRAQNFVPFNNTGVGSWGSSANWDTYIPGTPIVPEGQFNDVAVIENGGVAQVTEAFTTSTSPQGPGQIILSAGTIEIQDAGRLELYVPGGGLVDGSAVINGALNVQGGGQLFGASSMTFGATSTYSIDYTAGTSSPLSVTGSASLNGTLDLDFSGISAAGTHPVLTAGSVVGDFAFVNATGLGAAQTLVVSSSAGAVEATVSNVPTLTINRDTGEAVITNTHGVPLSLDGYSIHSALGALDASSFSGLARSGWEPAGVASDNLAAEAYEGPNTSSPSDAIPSSTPYTVGGSEFWSLPQPQAFLQDTEEVIFEVTDESYGADPVRGIVNYIGTETVNNNIVLYIDGDGNAAMLNESDFAQDVEIYQISSTGSPLQTDTWTPLEGQSGLDNEYWQVSAQSGATTLLEVTEDGSSNFDRFTRFDLGQILEPGFAESGITFDFLVEGDSAYTTGAVLFVDVIPDPDTPVSALGDFNDDGVVDAADYTTWRDNLGQSSSTINDNGSGAETVVQADYEVWRTNYGMTYPSEASLGANAAPEPACLGLLATLLSLAAARRKERCV